MHMSHSVHVHVHVHVLPWSHSESSSLLPAPLPHSHPRDILCPLDNRAPRVDLGHVLLSDGWIHTHAPVHAPTSPPLPRRSLLHNDLDGKAEQIIKNAAGRGVSITFSYGSTH